MFENKRFFLSRKEKGKIVKKISSILKKRKEIVFAYLFGSFLDEIPFKDIDIGIYLKKIDRRKALNYEMKLALEIEAKIKISIDIKILNFVPLYFQFHVLQDELLFTRDEEIWTNFFDLTIRKYLDFKPLRDEYLKELGL